MPRISKLLTALALLVALALVAVLILVLSRPAPATPLPNPNGYDDLVKAGRMLAGDFSNFGAADEPVLEKLVTNNIPACSLARTGLSRDSCVPPFSFTEFADHAQDFSSFKHLAQAFAAEGRLAELQGRPVQAAEAYLDTIRLAQSLTRGGVIIHGLVAVACEATGTARLEKLVSGLDAAGCRKVAASLEAIESRRVMPEQIAAEERRWGRRSGLKYQFAWVVEFRTMRQTEKGFIQRAKAQILRVRRLEADFAARAYELEHGTRPPSLAALVPTYLKALPQDPTTRSNLVYRP